jgi:hypothetical protein
MFGFKIPLISIDEQKATQSHVSESPKQLMSLHW